MLTQEDLQTIGKIVENAIDAKVPAIVKKVLDETLNDPEGVINVKFDAMQEQLDAIESRITSVEGRLTSVDSSLSSVDKRLDRVENLMQTQHDLERYEVGLVDRLDRRYQRKLGLSS